MTKNSFAAHISQARGYRTLIPETPTSRSAAMTGATRPSPTAGWQRADASNWRRIQMGNTPGPLDGPRPRLPEVRA